ncbi:MAG: hypothetical protein R2856_38505 [Caldilineaceae bacterium]
MGPLEVYFITIAVIVALIGLARGYAQELGSTMIILVAIFLLLFVEETRQPAADQRARCHLRGDFLSEQLFLSLFYQICFVAAVFAGYAGKTIQFTGKSLPPPQGKVLDLLIGALNGYLIAGTLWFYQQAYGYPFEVLGWTNPLYTNTPLASTLVQLLPQVLLPNATWWMVPIAVLLLLRVRG